ncbi:MAG: DNA polymerase III subunit delta [Phycisphaeraceae bacterium]
MAAASKKFAPTPEMRIVVLQGPDEWMRRHHFDTLLAVLTEAHGEIEVRRFDAETAELADVLDELRSYTLMQTYKVVVVDGADAFVKTHRPAMERYADAPVDHATLVLRAATWNAGKFDKKLAPHGVVVKCDAPSAKDAERWIVNRCQAAYGRAIRPDAAAALLKRIGPDLMQLDTELAKLALMAEGDAAITVALVDEHVERGSEERVWAVQQVMLDAVVTGRPAPLIAKLRELVDLAGHSEIAVGYFLSDLLRKLSVARMMLDRRVPATEVARQVRVWGPLQSPLLNAARSVDPQRVARLLHEALRVDQRTKSGFGDGVRNLECFCASLADVRK